MDRAFLCNFTVARAYRVCGLCTLEERSGLRRLDVNVSVAGRYAALYLYAGPSKVDAGKPQSAAAGSAGKGSSSDRGVVVQISNEAKAAQASLVSRSSQQGESVKNKVSNLYAEVAARGSSVTFDTSKLGELLDVSSLTNDELAKISVDRNGEFPTELSDYAIGALNARLAVTLEPFSSDLRAYQTGVQQLYQAMTPDVRQALGWNEAMLDMSKKLVSDAEGTMGKLDRKSFLARFLDVLKSDGSMTLDTSLLGFKDD